MMIRPKIVHLFDDAALGGVTRNLDLFKHPAIDRRYQTVIEEAHPAWSIAPRFVDAAIIVVHFSMSWRTLPFLYSLASLNAQAKFVLVEHSYSREWEEMHVPERNRFRSMLRLSHKVFDRVISVSEDQAKWLGEATGLKTPKCQVVYPWSNVDGLLQMPRPSFSIKKPLMIGAYGRFVHGKGFDRLIEAMNLFSLKDQIKLTIGGFGPDEDSLRHLAAQNANISFSGKVTDLKHYLSDCDIVAVPSRFEAFGLVATEARCAGRPILVSNVGGLPEQIGDGGISVDFDDQDAVVRLLRNIRYLPLVNMSVAAREACLGVTEQRIDCWIETFDAMLGNDRLVMAA